ncbi:NAD(P)-binding protein [Aspergillus japonicus CBS 114.51]|uniref:NAD(P)-binding protein n=1 Tax=Aspergillus japonicus CBS 114.51 TaxID=1448312 RepID=A0A8T8X3C9_ASPJA|nr:NAD(P)-binding protein [Aspergillus japonicus CBS 114.51]RAH82444.1 NAD(P)-binding protein [Aspergillus japonicus CBS 114.51]
MNPVNTKPYQLPADATWFITGCSSGIGRALATHVAAQPGHRLIATARNPASLSYLPDDNPAILKLALDVTSPAAVDAAFQAAAAHFGESYYIDVLVNNAGYPLSGDSEAVTEAEMHDEFETNFFGTVRVALKAIAVMRQSPTRRGGLIFNVSSVAGVCAFPGHAFYHASKFAVEGWTESVAREVHPDWNINFCIVEPGAVKTNFETTSKKHIKPHEAYAAPDLPARQLEVFVKKGLEAGVGVQPEQVAQVLYQVAARGEKVPLWLPLSGTAIMLITAKLQGRLQELETNKELSAIDKDQAQFKLN